MQASKTITFLFLWGAVFSCGEAKKDGEDEGEGTELKEVQGTTWQGFYTRKSSGKADEAPEPLAVKLIFGADGNFELKNLTTNETATGSYVDFTNRHEIVLNIAQSDFPSFGLKDGLQEYKYEGTGDELILFSETAAMKLKRLVAVEERKFLQGEWSCDDSRGNHWLFAINAADTFWLKISKDGSAVVLIRGNVVYSLDEQVAGELVVLDTQPAVNLKRLVWHKVNSNSRRMVKMRAFDKQDRKLDEFEDLNCYQG